jgi:lipoate-protein ligase A
LSANPLIPEGIDLPHAEWRLITHPPGPGAWNMAVDDAILEGVEKDSSPPTLRLYAWEPACVSLGFAQPVSDVDRESLSARGWGLVRRPTGGRAILHTDELTYAVIGSNSDHRLAGSVLESYCRLSTALLASLRYLNIPAEVQAISQGTNNGNSPVCFAVPSSYEITATGKKLVGSAQARRQVGMLQHGSLPLWGDHTRLVQGLHYADADSRQAVASRLAVRATTVEAVLGRRIAWEEAALAFNTAFEQVLNLTLVPGELSAWEHSQATVLMVEKYANPGWTERV